ncbi:phage terminase small subunit [Neisseria dentiae]|uniref:phage terminase small subunit n=1 Tax=Neisseria dentiae TaxID=194197 RepID=UPI0035A1555D
MTSPARAHKQAVLAAQSADVDLAAAEPYRRLQFLLVQDRKILESIKGVPDKITAKRQMIEKYRPWLEEVFASGRAQSSDTVFTTALLWLIDIGDLEAAAPLAEFAIAQDMAVSDQYRRDLKDLMFEEIAEQLAAGADLSNAAETRLTDMLTATDPETGLHVLNVMDQIRAKFLKACGERAEKADPARALALYEKALAYSGNVGVKKRIADLKKQTAA